MYTVIAVLNLRIVRPAERIIAAAKEAGINVRWLGATTEEKVIHAMTEDTVAAYLPLAELRASHEGFFPRLMGADAALA